jgi:nitrile hydratase accessory protein
VTAVVHALDLQGPAAPPRANGELVFEQPWQGRAFGLAMALTERGVVSYDAFRDHLIARIAAWEADPPEGEPYSYYAQWLQALEDVLDEQALVVTADVDARSQAYAVRPAGHDHGHEHGHDHQDHDH